jgi:hypothetical protein
MYAILMFVVCLCVSTCHKCVEAGVLS